MGVSERQFEEVLAAQDAPSELPPLTAFLTGGADRDSYNVTAQPLEPEFLFVLPGVQRAFARRIEPALSSLRNSYGSCIEDLRGDIERGFSSRLFQELAPALAVELNKARTNGLLEGETASGRFRDFIVNGTGSDEWIRYFFERRPVALELTRIVLDNFVDHVERLVGRMTADWPVLMNVMGLSKDTVPQRLVFDRGDRHQGGLSVVELQTNSGHKCYYKPRSLGMDAAFAQFLSWFHERAGFSLDFRSPRLVDCGQYGWMEHVEYGECISVEQVQRFYYRQGGLLSVMFLFGTHDMIDDNIVCSGEYPYYIDAECLVSPALPTPFPEQVPSSSAVSVFMESVMQSGLLPRWAYGDAERPGVASGGLFPMDGQPHSGRLVAWRDVGTDQMRQEVVEHTYRSPDRHLPRLNGELQVVGGHVDALIEGFREGYSLLLAERGELLADGGPLAPMYKAPFRLLLRDTDIYLRTRTEALHPRNQQCFLDVDLVFENLWGSHSNLIRGPVIQSEIDQMWNGDVPYFWGSGKNRDLHDGTGACVERDYFVESIPEGVARRLARMSVEDRTRQEAIIGQSLAVFTDNNAKRVRLPKATLEETGSVGRPTPERLIAASCRIADRILDQSFSSEEEISWIAANIGPQGGWRISAYPQGLYDGMDGVCLFFAYLSLLSGNEKYSEAACKIAWRSRIRLQELGSGWYRKVMPRQPFLSVFAHPLSCVHSLCHLESLLGVECLDHALVDNALDWIDRFVVEDERLDLVFGQAGALPLLMTLSSSSSYGDQCSELACVIGTNLVQRARRTGLGMCWDSIEFKGFAPFAHGSAGIGFVLTWLGSVTGRAEFVSAGLEANRYVQSMYQPDVRGWAQVPDEPASIHGGWCNGSSGIVLSHLLMAELTKTSPDDALVRIGGEHIVRNGLGQTHCICHGDAGAIEVLEALGRAIKEPAYACAVDRQLEHMCSWAESGEKWVSGMPERSVELLGLYWGLSGIGYQFLRLADWRRVPSVLVAEGPIREWRTLH
ncbi:MAG TPA: type 2 lanthipeptide synthetase LanM [Candidatus Krumholzibacteria bacterium]|nr:type 2 lanthipeptide synthetase LanM [Candidatus Krumholzibacteria bacterium]